MPSSFEVTIRPSRGWQPIDIKEILVYRELLAFLVWRDIKIRYRQTLLGGLWAVLQPLIAMLIFTFIFNRLAGVKSDGPPYPLFAFAGLVPWTFFSTAVSQSSNSLVSNQQLVSKVYFPRVFIPLGAIGALLLDLGLTLGFLVLLIFHYRWPISPNLLWLPVFILAAVLAASGVGLTLSAFNVSFRDVKYAVPFLIQMGIFRVPGAEGREHFWALKDVTFNVGEGDVVGIVGRNGAGKSTLLKVISRITDPTEGRVVLRARMASLLEVGTGFHPDLTGRENIFLNGAILGMRKAEIVSKFDEIVAFAELEKFLDTPVKHYSSGMYVRLGFAVAAHLNPEILVVDEVLSVGDIAFQKKCLVKMNEVSRVGRTVVRV